MEITYSPEGEESRSWQFTPRRLKTLEAEAIEGVGGELWEDFDTFGRLFFKNNRRALRAALWVLMRRDDPNLRFETLSIGAMDITVALGDDEVGRIRDLLRDHSKDIDPEQREFFINILGEDPALNADPKDPLPSDSPPDQTP